MAWRLRGIFLASEEEIGGGRRMSGENFIRGNSLLARGENAIKRVLCKHQTRREPFVPGQQKGSKETNGYASQPGRPRV